MKVPISAEALFDRDLDDHKNKRNLDSIPLFDRAKHSIYRTGLVTLPKTETLSRDPSSIPTSTEVS